MADVNLLKESKARRRERRPKTSQCLVPQGYRITEQQRKLIIQYFDSGKYSIAEIARACETSYSTAKSIIDKDPVLKEKWETAFNASLDCVEQAMVERAIDGRNEVAAQQAGEFLLRHHRKNTYSDKGVGDDVLKQLPKIVIPMVINRTTPVQPSGDVIDV